jgi:hypothetical protein
MSKTEVAALDEKILGLYGTNCQPATLPVPAGSARLGSLPLNPQHQSMLGACFAPNPSNSSIFPSEPPSQRNPLPGSLRTSTLTPASVLFGINLRTSRTITTSPASDGLNAARQPSSQSTSRQNPSPITTVPVCMFMRKSSIIANGLNAARQPSSQSKPPPLSLAVPVGIHLRQPLRSEPLLPPAVPVGIHLRQPPTPVVLPIFTVRQSTDTPNTHDTSAQHFEIKRTAAEARNHQRLETRNDLDRNLVGTLPPIMSIFDAPRATPDNDDFVPPSWLLETINRVASSPGIFPTPPPPVLFQTDPAALEHNAALLKKYDDDLSKLLSDFQDTTIAYGSEFPAY